jgi:two-component system invasion response regulator UvrY
MSRKILIAEDLPLMTRSIRLICKDEKIDNLEEVDSCRLLVEILQNHEFSHLILDLTLADGSAMTIVEHIVIRYPALRILIYSIVPDKFYAPLFWRRYGIPFLSKRVQEDEQIPKLLAFLNDTGERIKPSGEEKETPFDKLTPAEWLLLPHLLKGLSPMQIAKIMGGKTNDTIRFQKHSIHKKTGTENLVELIELAKLYEVFDTPAA